MRNKCGSCIHDGLFRREEPCLICVENPWSDDSVSDSRHEPKDRGCSCCKKTKRLVASNFYPCATNPEGFNTRCIECLRSQARAKYERRKARAER